MKIERDVRETTGIHRDRPDHLQGSASGAGAFHLHFFRDTRGIFDQARYEKYLLVSSLATTLRSDA